MQKLLLIKKKLSNTTSITFNTILPPPKQSNTLEHEGRVVAVVVAVVVMEGLTATEDKPSVVTIQTVAMEMSELIALVAFSVCHSQT